MQGTRVTCAACWTGRRPVAFRLTAQMVCRKLSVVKTLTTHTFTRDFGKHKKEPCLVTSKGRLIGAWQPILEKPGPVNFAERVKEYCSKPLPFTFANLVKEGRQR